MDARGLLAVAIGLVACKSEVSKPTASSAQPTVSASVTAKPPPPSPEETLRKTIAAASKGLPAVHETRRFPFHIIKESGETPKAPNADVAPILVKVDGEGIYVDGKKVSDIPKPDEPEPSAADAVATNPNARVKVLTYGPPAKLPALRKVLADKGGGIAGLRLLPGIRADVLRGALDALRREGYRDVWLQTSDDPSKVALARLIWTQGREGIKKADAQERFMSLDYRDGKASIGWAESTKSAISKSQGKTLALSELTTGLCAEWKQNGSHVEPDDPVADALVINTLFATPEFVNASLAAAAACKRSNGRPALWVAVRQMVFK